MQNWSVPLPNHGQSMAGPSPHTTESTRPAEKAWCKTRRHGAPLQVHVFIVCYEDLSFSHSRNHASRMVFYPCILLLQCVLTRKRCHALSSLGVLAILLIILVLLVLLLLLLVLLLVLLVLLAKHMLASPAMQMAQVDEGRDYILFMQLIQQHFWVMFESTLRTWTLTQVSQHFELVWSKSNCIGCW
jgi:hypothetical protein